MSTRLETMELLGSATESARADVWRYLVPLGRLLLAAPFTIAWSGTSRRRERPYPLPEVP